MQKRKKHGWWILCFMLIGLMGMTGCGKGEAQSTVSLGIDGYVYVPTYDELPTEENAYINNYVIEGDTLYYLQTSYGEGRKDEIFEMALLEGGDPQSIQMFFPENGSVTQMMVDENGNFIFVIQNYDESGGTFSIETYDPQGTVISSLDVTEQVNEDPNNAYVQYMTMDKEGNFYLSNGETIWLYRGDGQYQGKIEIPNFIYSIGLGKDGKVYVVYYGENGQEIAALDFAGKAIGQVYKNFPNSNNGNLIQGINSDFLINDGSGLLEYDLATQTAVKILDWVDSDVSGQSVTQYSVLSDGRIVTVGYNWDGDTNHTELTYLVKTPVSEMPEKEIILAASLYDSYSMREKAIQFNKKSDKYRIKLKTYIDTNAEWTDTLYADAITALNNEITTKQAPDILLLSSDAVDLNAYASKGVFLNLNDFLEKDEELKKEDLIDSVVKTYTYDDKLLALPDSFSIQSIIALTSDVGEQPGWTVEDMEALMDKYPDKIVLPYATRDSMLQVFLACSLDAYIDWEKGTCHFNDDNFKNLLKLCSRFPKEIDDQATYEDTGDGLLTGKQLVDQAYIYDVQSYQVLAKRIQKPITYIGFPTADGSSGNAIQPMEGVYTITGKSKHKEGAWEFVKYALQADSQYGGSFSVLKSDLEQAFEEAMTPEYDLDENGDPLLDAEGNKVERSKGGYSYGSGSTIELYAATQDEIDGLKELIDSATLSISAPMDVLTIISEESQAYFEEQKTVDEVADIIQSRLQIYVSENS